MINSTKQLLKDLESKNAMEVLPQLDELLASINTLRNTKLDELLEFSSKYGVYVSIHKEAVTQADSLVSVVEDVTVRNIKEDVDEMLENAKVKANKILENAKVKANTIVEDAKEKANNYQAKLEESVDAILGEAEKEAEESIYNANYKSSLIIKEAEQLALNIINDARKEALSINNNVSTEVVEEVIEEVIESLEEEIIETVPVIESLDEERIETVPVLVFMEEDKKHRNAHFGRVDVNGRTLIFHSAKFIDTPLVYNAEIGDEQIVKDKILAEDPTYFDKASSILSIVNHDDKTAIYKNSSNIYVGYIGKIAFSWDKSKHNNPSYLPCKYINRKGFIVADKQDFIDKVKSLVNIYEAKATEIKESVKDTFVETEGEKKIDMSKGITIDDLAFLL